MTAEDPREPVYRRALLVIVVAGAAWRLVMLAAKWNHRILLNDSLYYTVQAQDNARGKWFLEPFTSNPGAEHPPLTTLVLTPVSRLAHPEAWQRATMTAIGICLVPLIAVLARRVGGRRVALIAAAIAAVYPNLWMSDSLIMSESLTLVLVTVVLIAALAHQRDPRPLTALVCGAAIGVAGLARAEVLLLAPLIALVGVRSIPLRRWVGGAAIVVVIPLVVIAPWVAWNTARFDRLVLMSTNDGTTLRGANCPLTYSGRALGGWSLLCLGDDGQLGPRPGETSAAVSARRRREALDYAREHMGRTPVVVAARVLRAADLYGLGDLVFGDVGEERPRWAVWAGIIAWWVLAPLAAIGLVRTRPGVRWVLSTPVVTVAVVTVVFYGAHRLRVPMEPVVVVGAASCIAGLLRQPWASHLPVVGGSGLTAAAAAGESPA